METMNDKDEVNSCEGHCWLTIADLRLPEKWWRWTFVIVLQCTSRWLSFMIILCTIYSRFKISSGALYSFCNELSHSKDYNFFYLWLFWWSDLQLLTYNWWKCERWRWTFVIVLRSTSSWLKFMIILCMIYNRFKISSGAVSSFCNELSHSKAKLFFMIIDALNPADDDIFLWKFNNNLMRCLNS